MPVIRDPHRAPGQPRDYVATWSEAVNRFITDALANGGEVRPWQAAGRFLLDAAQHPANDVIGMANATEVPGAATDLAKLVRRPKVRQSLYPPTGPSANVQASEAMRKAGVSGWDGGPLRGPTASASELERLINDIVARMPKE